MNTIVIQLCRLAILVSCFRVLPQALAQSSSYCQRCKFYVNQSHTAAECDTYRSLPGNRPPPPGSTGAGSSRNDNFQQMQQAQQIGVALGSLFESIARSRAERNSAPSDSVSPDTTYVPRTETRISAPDPQKIEEQKRLAELKSAGLDKVSWQDAANTYRSQLSVEEKQLFDAELSKIVGKKEWESFQGSKQATSAGKPPKPEPPVAPAKPKLSPEEEAELNDWNKFASDTKDKYSKENNYNNYFEPLRWRNAPKPSDKDFKDLPLSRQRRILLENRQNGANEWNNFNINKPTPK